MKSHQTATNLSLMERFVLASVAIILGVLLFFLKGQVSTDATLSNLADRSLDPEVALKNGRPTIFEFYADWCEACQEMSSDMLELEAQNLNKLDLVLLNVDNPRWLDLIEKYNVQGIPQLNFFSSEGKLLGASIGIRSFSELKVVAKALIMEETLPNLLNSEDLKHSSFELATSRLNQNSSKPMSHS